MLNANTYVTDEEGIGGTIRNQYEDFYVEEIPEVTPTGEGPNIWIWIEKVGRTTLDVVLDIARDLHISRKRMGFAGMKDKKPVLVNGFVYLIWNLKNSLGKLRIWKELFIKLIF